jgi:Pyruvate/2-oxoacid:ferredoxin oxidoreductase gamma subunit
MASAIALEEIGRPITNSCMLGAFARVTGWLKLDSLIQSFEDYFKGQALDNNIRCAQRGFSAAEIMRFGGS